MMQPKIFGTIDIDNSSGGKNTAYRILTINKNSIFTYYPLTKVFYFYNEEGHRNNLYGASIILWQNDDPIYGRETTRREYFIDSEKINCQSNEEYQKILKLKAFL